MELRARDWTFVAEGNLHVVCRYSPSSQPGQPLLQGKVLRLTKEKGRLGIHRLPRVSQEIVKNVLNPFFGADIVLGAELLALPEGFLVELSDALHEKRPAWRRIKSLNLDATFGELMLDAFSIFRIPGTSFRQVITVEVKVKCGLSSSSPLVPPSRHLKRQLGRFRLMQLYKAAGAAADSDGASKSSNYNPCDLCSMNPQSIRRALAELFATPQNNLRITTTTGSELEPEMRQLLLDSLANILSNEQEPVLHRLQLLQSFDLIDIEGAAFIFERLETLMPGKSPELIEEIICDSFVFDASSIFELLDCLSSSRRDSSELPRRPEWTAIAKLLELADNGQSQAQSLEYSHFRALEVVGSLTVSEAILLLQLWLLALAAKDASLIVSLSPMKSPGPSEIQVNERGAGWITASLGQDSVAVAYSLGLVDFGLKHPRKCWALEKREKEIAKILF